MLQLHDYKFALVKWTYFSGIMLTYGIVFLSTNEPKPRRKLLVISDIDSAEMRGIKLMKTIPVWKYNTFLGIRYLGIRYSIKPYNI